MIFTAAGQGNDKLRYFVGVDNLPLIKVRREMTEEDCIRFVRTTVLWGKRGPDQFPSVVCALRRDKSTWSCIADSIYGRDAN